MNLAFGNKIIYEDADFDISRYDKAGVVGVNGAGKTTLFRILLGEQELDSGSIVAGNLRIGHLPQEVVIGEETGTVLDYLQEGRPIGRLQEELNLVYQKLESAGDQEQIRLLKRMDQLQSQLEYYDCYEAGHILLTIIERMGIDIDLLDMPINRLSGGQKSKIAFARVLYSKPEILLLDEPTNHLDEGTRGFVTDFLRNYKGMVLIISHDTDFLNQVINKILFINKSTHKISVFLLVNIIIPIIYGYLVRGLINEQEKRLQELVIDREEKEIKELEGFVQRARQASRTNHAIKRMGQERALRLEKKQDALHRREGVCRRVKMDIRPLREGAGIPLEVEGLWFHYPNQPYLYRDLNFHINAKERFLVVGENGVGTHRHR